MTRALALAALAALLCGCDLSSIELRGDAEDGGAESESEAEAEAESEAESEAEGEGEVCNGEDDDGDGVVDEGFDLSNDRENCGACGNECVLDNAFSACVMASCVITTCAATCHDYDGEPDNGCEYCCVPSSTGLEACNELDDDCDGEVDEGFDLSSDLDNCGDCGAVCLFANATPACVGGDCEILLCDEGWINLNGDILDGCEYACEPTGDEVCDGLDNDCDEEVDEEPGEGALCGTDAGECAFGVFVCAGDGTMVCEGATDPVGETCNLADDDCDGFVDEGIGSIGPCGTSVGECEEGTYVCLDGVTTCVGSVPAASEICDGLDNDCDGTADEALPVGDACGTDDGECTAGVLTCVGGSLVCSGYVGGSVETCDGLDNDCDGSTDEIFDFDSDPLHCGGCAACDLPYALEGCSAGACTIAGCETGRWDDDGVVSNGCEYACVLSGSEICDGLDNDCNGDVDADDPGMPPLGVDPCLSTGECAVHTVSCTGGAWVCGYAATVETTAPGVVAPEESWCDGLDNDCDGEDDEVFPLGDPCSGGGVGACESTGTYACDTIDTVECVITSPGGAAGPETCDGEDDDCDGLVDENSDGPVYAGVSDSLVNVVRGGLNFWVYDHEASRPGATSASVGVFENRACSVAGVLPWASVTYADAAAACTAAGMSLCTPEQWYTACSTPATTTVYPYGNSYGATTCNGNDYDTVAGGTDDDNAIATGTLGGCVTEDGVNDMSGNLKEWTDDPVDTGPPPGPEGYRVRGGSYDNIDAGLTCAFDETVLPPAFLFPNVGFRCCCTTGASCPP